VVPVGDLNGLCHFGPHTLGEPGVLTGLHDIVVGQSRSIEQ